MVEQGVPPVGERLTGRIAGYYEIATTLLLLFSIVYVFVFRTIVFRDLPLWMDESWTAVLARAPSFHSFAHQMWLDSNAPFYYGVIWIWPFKDSFGLRLPSIIFMVLSCAVAYLWRADGVPKSVALAWSAMLMLWVPGTILFGDARYYALLYLLSTLQTVAFVRLDKTPRLSHTFVWVGFATVAILTHYFAAFLACAQGVYFLCRHRAQAISNWPALLLTVPAFAYLAWHWPRLTFYAQPGTSWYERLSATQAINCAQFVLGGAPAAWGLLLALVIFGYRKRPSATALAVIVPVMTSMIVLCALGMAMPMLIKRYMLPLVPPAMLGLALLMRPGGYIPVVLWLLANLGTVEGQKSLLVERGAYGLDLPVRLLPDGLRVTWWIDYPGSRVHDRPQMAEMLRDAFWRNSKVLRAAEWGTNYASSDAIILVRPTIAYDVAPPPHWPCRTLSTHWEQSTLVCVRPELSQ